jgi:pimeloyl-ACP methyl ester carboxylesterase
VGPSRPPSIVLIMGWGGDHTAWAFQIPALAAEFDVIALDNRGAGQSDAPDRPFTLADMADDVVALMDELGVRTAHICGASMGGMIAQELALRHPERVLTLQLHCTTAGVDGYGRLVIDNFLRVKARADAEEFTHFTLPWLLCRKTFTDHPDFVEAWIQRAVEYPFQTSLVGLSRQAEAIRGQVAGTGDHLARIREHVMVGHQQPRRDEQHRLSQSAVLYLADMAQANPLWLHGSWIGLCPPAPIVEALSRLTPYSS